jgi:hypothetical protein
MSWRSRRFWSLQRSSIHLSFNDLRSGHSRVRLARSTECSVCRNAVKRCPARIGATPFGWNRRKPNDRRTSCCDRSPPRCCCPYYRYRLHLISRSKLAQSPDGLSRKSAGYGLQMTHVVEQQPYRRQTRRQATARSSAEFEKYQRAGRDPAGCPYAST